MIGIQTMTAGKRTPWGVADHVKEYAEGIVFYGTPSHGGFKLDRQRNAAVPDYMRRAGGWYEEDCDWAIVATVHPIAFKNDPKALEDARRSLCGWHPDEYERWYGVELQPGESRVKDERRFHVEHANDLLVLAAWGDWHDKVPAGMVGVVASTGGSRTAGREAHRYFLVPQDEYNDKERRRFSFIVDPTRYQEIDAIR